MLDKFVYEILHFIMKYAGMLNSWAWRKHAKMLEDKRQKEKKDCLQKKNTVKNLEYTYVQHVMDGIFQRLVSYD